MMIYGNRYMVIGISVLYMVIGYDYIDWVYRYTFSV